MAAAVWASSLCPTWLKERDINLSCLALSLKEKEKKLTLDELKQVKADVDNGIMVSKGTWLKLLEWAIELTKHHETGKGPKNACDEN